MSKPDDPSHELLKLQIEVWKQAIASTMHFTEMSQKSRQLGLTFVVGSFALALTLLAQYRDARVEVPIGANVYDLHVAGIIILFSLLGLYVTMLLDVKLYHRMLRGSVAFTDEFEAKVIGPALMKTDRHLTASITHFSRSRSLLNRVWPESRTSAEWKIKFFYILSMAFVGAVGAALLWTTAQKIDTSTIRINQRIQIEGVAKPQPPTPKK